MNCVIMQMRTHFRGHTEKKGGRKRGGGREIGGGRREGEGGRVGEGGEMGREEIGKGVGRERGGKEIEGQREGRGEGVGGKRKEGREREISLTAAKQSHLPDSSHAQWEPAEANFWSHSWHSYRTNTDAGQQTAWDN